VVDGRSSLKAALIHTPLDVLHAHNWLISNPRSAKVFPGQSLVITAVRIFTDKKPFLAWNQQRQSIKCM